MAHRPVDAHALLFEQRDVTFVFGAGENQFTFVAEFVLFHRFSCCPEFGRFSESEISDWLIEKEDVRAEATRYIAHTITATAKVEGMWAIVNVGTSELLIAVEASDFFTCLTVQGNDAGFSHFLQQWN